ncbi:MAG: tetratricopeptide repeat protein [Flavobacteriales bacterium]|nr:tetratricopeptide repeat protein [Flavobacteriales bacterium]
MIFVNKIKALVKQHFAVVGVILFSIILLFPVINNGWVLWDDPAYVLENEYLKITSWDSIFHQFNFVIVQGNYHPLTILSLALDYSIDGLNPKVFHTTNLLLHLMNVVLVYIFVFRLFRDKSIALFVALLFAIHPMHLESFAWVSERKDVLYVFFFLLGLLQYLNYQKKQTYRTYLLCLFFFLLSLFSKGMAVVFPVVLLLLDYVQNRKFKKKTLLEKIPFFILSLIFGLMVIKIQDGAGAISSNADAPFLQTFLVPIYGLFMYLLKLIVPLNLSALHPYPMMLDGKIPLLILISIFPLLLITGLIIKFYRKDRPVVFGFLFFLIVIFPVLQFVSVGSAIIAERYTYLSYLGLFISLGLILKFILAKLEGKWKILFQTIVLIYLGFLSIQTEIRVGVWENDETLWSDVIESYPDDYFAYMKRGSFRAKKGQQDVALSDLNKSISISPNDYYTFNNRGMIYLSRREYALAEQDFSKAIKIDSTLYEAFLNRGLVLLNTRRYKAALADFKKSTELEPNNELNYLNLALLYERMNVVDQVFSSYEKALQLNPNNAQSYYYRGQFYYKRRAIENALNDFNKVIQFNSNYPNGYYWKAKTLLAMGKRTEARKFIQKARAMGYSISQEEWNEFED